MSKIPSAIGGSVVMDGVIEYNEGIPVHLEVYEGQWQAGGPKIGPGIGRLIVVAQNESGHNSVCIDLDSLIEWFKKNAPEKLRD